MSHNKHLWAPWKMEYIKNKDSSLKKQKILSKIHIFRSQIRIFQSTKNYFLIIVII